MAKGLVITLTVMLILLLMTWPADGNGNEIPPMVQMVRTTDLVVMPASGQAVEWQYNNFNGGMFSADYLSRITAPRNCLYLMIAQVRWSQGYEGDGAHISIVRNGRDVLATSYGDSVVTMDLLWNTDYVELWAYVEGEASRRIVAENLYTPSFSVVCISLLEQ